MARAIAETMPPLRAAPVVRLRSAFIWRLLHAVLPLGQRFNALLRQCYRDDALLSVPWDGRWLTISGAWLNVASSASAPIYRTPRRQNPEFFAILEPLLKTLPDGCIVDVGANIGTYTLAFRDRTEAPIVAFEPDPFCFALLARNVRDNTLRSVVVKNAACGDTQGELGFNTGINGAVAGAADRPAISVPAVRLDDELRDIGGVGLIKIDCEGYEWQVLNGCREVIAAQRPVFFIELHPNLIGRYGHSLSDVCEMLRPFYRLQFWEIDPSQRSRSRIVRYAGRYRSAVVSVGDENDMLALAAETPRPDQIFLLAVPRRPRPDTAGE